MRGNTAAVAVLLLAVFAAGCKERGVAAAASKRKRGPMAFPVALESVRTETVEYSVRAVGTVEAFEKVQITARVAGVLERVSFREGDRVRSGQTLATIEPVRYRLAADAARAELEKAKASRADSEAGLSRREAAVAKSPGLIPGEEVATWRTRLRSADAEVAGAQAALAQAELALRDAYVRAPLAGVIETRSAQTGQYVQPGSVVATLIRRDPLLLRFGVPPVEARRLARDMKVNFSVQESAQPYEAIITHVADAADAATRMVAVTAEVVEDKQASSKKSKKAKKLKKAKDVSNEPPVIGPRPGAFAEVVVPLGGGKAAPVIPETAIRPSEKGFIAFVVEDGKAAERILELGLRTDDGRVEVRSGLKPNEALVVRGAEALRPGVAVVAETPKAEPETGSADQPAPAQP